MQINTKLQSHRVPFFISSHIAKGWRVHRHITGQKSLPLGANCKGSTPPPLLICSCLFFLNKNTTADTVDHNFQPTGETRSQTEQKALGYNILTTLSHKTTNPGNSSDPQHKQVCGQVVKVNISFYPHEEVQKVQTAAKKWEKKDVLLT